MASSPVCCLGPRDERGQASILLVGIVAFGLVVVATLLALSRASVDQARAQTAADAVALAAVGGSAEDIAWWYRGRGTEVVVTAERVTARVDESTAQAAAVMTRGDRSLSPVLVAVIARAEQLLERPLVPVPVNLAGQRAFAFDLSQLDAQSFAAVALEFGLCEDPNLGAASDLVRFRWC